MTDLPDGSFAALTAAIAADPTTCAQVHGDTDTATARTLITEPEMEDTHYGITVAHIGDEGDMIALGHHSPRRALAAFNRHARVFVGLVNIADDRSETAAEWLDGIKHERAVFRKPNPNDEWEEPDMAWVADWSNPDDPDARPVTLLGI